MKKILKTACGFETNVSHLNNFKIQAMIDSMNERVERIDTSERGLMVIYTKGKWEDAENGNIGKMF